MMLRRSTTRRVEWTYIRPAILFIAAFLYLVVLAHHYYDTGRILFSPNDPELSPLLVIVSGTMVVAGLARYSPYHPGASVSYGRWLMMTPWTPADPLPLGPPTLAWQDVLFCGGMFLLDRYHLHADGALPLLLFLLGYYFPSWFLFLATGAVPHALVLLAAIPPVLIFVNGLWIQLACIAALYAVHYLGTQKSLRKFPWKLAETRNSFAVIDWPFSRLGPIELKEKVPLRIGLLSSALAGWEIFCFSSLIDAPPGRDTADLIRVVIAAFGGLVALIRLLTYQRSVAAPITLFGRIATGRLIIPRYDQVFIGPLATLMITGLIVALPAGMPLSVVWGAGVFAILLVATGMPPSLYRWQLTGAYRMVPAPVARVNRRPQPKSFQLSLSSERE